MSKLIMWEETLTDLENSYNNTEWELFSNNEYFMLAPGELYNFFFIALPKSRKLVLVQDTYLFKTSGNK